MDVEIKKLDEKEFPCQCVCGLQFRDAREFMDHLLPAHVAVKK